MRTANRGLSNIKQEHEDKHQTFERNQYLFPKCSFTLDNFLSE